jgi:hypothetical protein
MATMFVKPGINPETGEPFHVRIPHTFAKMAIEGEDVPDDYFWKWMLRHGDVVAAERPKPPVESPAPELIAGEPLRLTAAEWAAAGDAKINDPSGAAGETGFALAEGNPGRDPAAPLLTHDEYLAAQPATEA